MSTFQSGARPLAADPVVPAQPVKQWLPTRKWLVGFGTAVAAVVVHLIATGEFDGAEQGGTLVALLFAVASYIVKNPNTLQGKWPADPSDPKGERGQGAVNLLLYILAAIILIIVIFALLDRL